MLPSNTQISPKVLYLRTNMAFCLSGIIAVTVQEEESFHLISVMGMFSLKPESSTIESPIFNILGEMIGSAGANMSLLADRMSANNTQMESPSISSPYLLTIL